VAGAEPVEAVPSTPTRRRAADVAASAASLLVAAAFLARLASGPIVEICLFLSVAPASYYAQNVALAAGLGLWGALAIAWFVNGRFGRTGTGPRPSALWLPAAALLMVDGVAYYLSIPFGSACKMWPFHPL